MESQDKLQRADYIALAAIWLFFIARCIVLGGGFMFLDEVYSFCLVNGPSVNHLLFALSNQADAAPPGYYFIAKVWSAVFSGSPRSLRMFSVLGFCAGFTLLWVTMRQAFRFLPTLFAFAMILGYNKVIAFQTLNARFYGLLFALVCLVMFLAVRICKSDRPSLGLLAANVLVNAALVLSHPLAVFYSAAILFGLIVFDLSSRPWRFRPGVILSYFLGWVAIFLSIPQLLHQVVIMKPHGWVPVPGLAAFLWELHNEADLFLTLLFFIVFGLISLVTARSHPMAQSPALPRNLPRGLLLIGICLIGVMPLFWVISHVVPAHSIFTSNYMVGAAIGWTIMLAFATTYAFDRVPFRSPLIQGILVSVFMVLATRSLWAPTVGKFLHKSSDPRESLTGAFDSAYGHPDLPVVCAEGGDFVTRNFYSPNPERYYFLLDRPAAIAPDAWIGAVVDYNVLSATKRDYPDATHIVDASQFLRDHPAFLLQDVPGTHWPALYLKSGNYKITPLEPDRPLGYGPEDKSRLFLVEKQP